MIKYTVWFNKDSKVTLGDLFNYIDRRGVVYVPQYNGSKWTITVRYDDGDRVEELLDAFKVRYRRKEYEVC